jgi:hypothetical protein
VRTAAQQGRPFGARHWRDEVARRFDLRWTLRSCGSLGPSEPLGGLNMHGTTEADLFQSPAIEHSISIDNHLRWADAAMRLVS